VTERGGTPQQAEEFVTKLYKQVPVLDPAARGSTTTFAQKKIGDVHLTWENEAHLELAEFPGQLELVYPPLSFLAEPPLAVVDANVKRKGTREVAEAYLNFAYTDEGQELIAKNFYRPTKPETLKKYVATFPEIKLFPSRPSPRTGLMPMRSTSLKARCSTPSIWPEGSRVDDRRQPPGPPRVPPDPGVQHALSEPAGADPARGVLSPGGLAEPE